MRLVKASLKLTTKRMVDSGGDLPQVTSHVAGESDGSVQADDVSAEGATAPETLRQTDRDVTDTLESRAILNGRPRRRSKPFS